MERQEEAVEEKINSNDHYYSENPQVESAEKEITFEFKNQKFSFITDRGVFSKDHVDSGSLLLLEALFSELDNLSTLEQVNFQKIVKGNKLDLGAGYGVLAIVLQKFYPEGRIILSDINERALALCLKNAERNLIKNLKIRKSAGFEKIPENFDLILSNPPIRTGKENVQTLLRDAKSHLNSGGLMLVVIGKKQGASSYGKYLESIFPETWISEKKKGFTVFACRN